MTQAQPWRTVIVDDEPPARQSLRVLLDRHPDFQIVAECGHGAEAIAAVRSHAPHVLFLDVQMPGLDGFDVLEEIGPDTVPALVFATAYDTYALRAFERHALEYLLKPFSDERFHAVIAHVESRLREHTLATSGEHLAALLATRRRDSLVLRDGRRTIAIPYDEIIWFEAEDYYTRVHARRGRTLVRLSLRTLAASLAPDRFTRIHRSAIVNLSCIREVEPLASGDQRLVLNDGTELRVSRTFRAELEARLNSQLPTPKLQT